LTNKQVREGRSILENYYQKFIATESVFRQPLAIEGKIQATIQFENLEFSVSGRYDRIDYLDDGLGLIINQRKMLNLQKLLKWNCSWDYMLWH